MTNAAIAAHFETLAKLLEVHGENAFKAKSYASAAFAIEKLPQPLAGMSEDDLFRTRGIGQSVGEKVKELLYTGDLAVLRELLARTPGGILQMMGIKGLGPKKIAAIWKELGIETLGELAYACEENRLAGLKGFGAKTQQNVADAIRFFQQNEGLHLWAHTEAFAVVIIGQLAAAFPGSRTAVTGALRRQAEILPLAHLITDLPAAALHSFFSDREGAELVHNEAEQSLTVRLPGQPVLLLRLSEAERFATDLFVTTGSDEFVGAFLSKHHLPPAAATEEAIFHEAGLPFLPAALRESAALLEGKVDQALEELITERDIRGIIHSHSTWSDGQNTIAEMAAAAKAAGLDYLVISDHSQAAFYANGLSPARLREQHVEIDALNAQLAPFRIFKSIEADILNDGRLDYDDEILASFDLVIASIHSNLKMPLEKAMDRLLAAIANPYTTILGHMTGRLLLSRQGYPVDHKTVIDACAEHNVVIEINAHPRRLDMDWRWVRHARERGALLSINPDAHSVKGFGDVRYGALIAQKGGLRPEENLSSFSLAAFEAFLDRQRAKRR